MFHDLHYKLLQEAILIAKDEEPIYGSDQANISHPRRFGTVTFALENTDTLRSVIERMRKENDVNIGDNPHIAIYLGINNFTDVHVNSCIDVEVFDTCGDPDGNYAAEHYSIDLNEEDQGMLFILMNKQTEKFFGMTLMEMLEKAERKMMADAEKSVDLFSVDEKSEDMSLEERVRKALENGEFVSDSDIEDYAEENGVYVGRVMDIVWSIISENTPCHGCKHVAFMTSGMYPCNSCVKRAKNLYEPKERNDV